MADMVLAGVLGVVVTLVIILALHVRRTERQLSALRLKVAQSNFSRELEDAEHAPAVGGTDNVTPAQVVRRKRHLGLIRGGGAAAVLVWLLRRTREHQLAAAATGAAAILTAVGAFVLLSDPAPQHREGSQQPGPASSAPQSMPSSTPPAASPSGVPPSADAPQRTGEASMRPALVASGEASEVAVAEVTGGAPGPSDGTTPSPSTTASPSTAPPASTTPATPRPGVCVTLALDPLLGATVCLPGDD